MYTPKQTAEMLNLAQSTLRKYARLFSEHLSPNANRKQRNYVDQDIATLKRVVELRSEGYQLKDIPDQLNIVTPTPKPENSLALVPNIATEFQGIRDLLAQQTNEIDTLRTELKQLKGNHERLQKWLKTPWWRRIGRNPND